MCRWGKPPVDEFGRPLYGDVFGTAAPERDMVTVQRLLFLCHSPRFRGADRYFSLRFVR